MTENAEFGDDVYTDGVEDADDMDALENLTGDDPDEPQETGYSPPESRPVATRFGNTAAEQEEGESLDERLAQEVPDIDDGLDEFDDPKPGAAEEDFGDAAPRAGRLVAPDEGAHDDEESDSIATDVGPAGFASSAEEAAMHVVDEDELNEQGTNEDDIGN